MRVCLQPVLWCLLDLLLVLEKPPCTPRPSSSPRRLCRHDDVLCLMLTNMEAEHKVALRRVYASALPAYVDRWVFLPQVHQGGGASTLFGVELRLGWGWSLDFGGVEPRLQWGWSFEWFEFRLGRGWG